jgi:hypothetical protein
MDFNSIATLAVSWFVFYCPYLALGLSALMVFFIIATKERLNAEQSELNSQLAEKTKELKSLSFEVIPLREKVHTLENSLTDKDREVVTKADEVFRKDKSIHALENQTAEMQKRIESLSNEALLAKEEGMKIREELEKTRLVADIMTIEVDRKDKGDDFNILDLKLFHRDCGGGLVIASHKDHEYFFECKRCDVIHRIDDDDNNKLGVVNTAINGIGYIAACSERGYKKIKFTQKQSALLVEVRTPASSPNYNH